MMCVVFCDYVCNLVLYIIDYVLCGVWYVLYHDMSWVLCIIYYLLCVRMSCHILCNVLCIMFDVMHIMYCDMYQLGFSSVCYSTASPSVLYSFKHNNKV